MEADATSVDPDVTVSIVSHAQSKLINELLGDLEREAAGDVRVIITENLADSKALTQSGWSFPFEIVVNQEVKGFGANHNAAFRRCQTPYFCVLNPDIRLTGNPFRLLRETAASEGVGVVAPLVRNPSGGVEDSARRFPTAASLVRKLFERTKAPDYPVDAGPLDVDWVAGMFMLFPSAEFGAIGGFDESYFLYYEDVDICRRLHRKGRRVIFDARTEVIHDARRASRRDPRMMRHHAASVLRYLLRG